MEHRRASAHVWQRLGVVLVLLVVVLTEAACGSSPDSASHRVEVRGPVLTKQGWTGPQVIAGNPAVHVASVSCTDSHFCVAVGSAYMDSNSYYPFSEYPAGSLPEASTYDGHSWSSPIRLGTRPFAQGAETLSCTSTTFCLATDGHGTSYVFNGSNWRVAPMHGFVTPGDTPSLAETVACARPAFCVATLQSGQIMEFRGGRWSLPRVLKDGFAAKVVGCLDEHHCAVGGAYGVLEFDGFKWRDSGLGVGFVFYSLSCSAGTHSCSATGQDGFGSGVWDWRGKQWKVTQVPPTPPPHPGQRNPPTLESARLSASSTQVSVGSTVMVSGTECPMGHFGVAVIYKDGPSGTQVVSGGRTEAPAPVGPDGIWSAAITGPLVQNGPAAIGGYCTQQVSGAGQASEYIDFEYPPLPVAVVGTPGVGVSPTGGARPGSTINLHLEHNLCQPGAYPVATIAPSVGNSTMTAGGIFPTARTDPPNSPLNSSIAIPSSFLPGSYVITVDCLLGGRTFVGDYEPVSYAIYG